MLLRKYFLKCFEKLRKYVKICLLFNIYVKIRMLLLQYLLNNLKLLKIFKIKGTQCWKIKKKMKF